MIKRWKYRIQGKRRVTNEQIKRKETTIREIRTWKNRNAMIKLYSKNINLKGEVEIWRYYIVYMQQ